MSPEIHTKRLRLTPYVAGFVTKQHVDWLNDPEVTYFSDQKFIHHTLTTQHSYLNKLTSTEHNYIWLIKVAEADIGSITAFVNPYHRIANMGILMGDKHAWGKGYGAEAWGAVMKWLWKMEEPLIRKIECGTMQDNRGMRRVATKCGMDCESVRPGHFLLDGQPQALAMYGRFRP